MSAPDTAVELVDAAPYGVALAELAALAGEP